MSGSGYVRQSASNISSGQPISSAPVNNEFNALQSAFSGTTGHAHDGSTGNGPNLTSTAFGLNAATAGIVGGTGTEGAFQLLTLTGTSNQITVTNGTGAAGNPTISLPTAVTTGSYTANNGTPAVNGLYLATTNTPAISANSLPVAKFTSATSAVNYLALAASATGNAVTLGAAGADTNISISLLTQGNGVVEFPSGTSTLPSVSIGGTGTGIFQPASSELGFSLGGTEYYIMTTTGFGIGTTPSYALDVSGGARVTGSVVLSGATNNVGTITTGTWNGSLVTGTYGGTGVNNGNSTITLGGNFTTSGSNALTFTTTTTTSLTLPASGTLVNSAVATLSNLASIGTITSGTWQGTPVALAYGGTNANLTASNGGIVYSGSSAFAVLSGTATANQVLLSGASGAPAWSTATYPATTTVAQLLYSSSNNVVAGLTAGVNQVLVCNGSGTPSWGTAIPNGITATTQTSSDNSTKLATTAFVQANATTGALLAANNLSDLGTLGTALTNLGFTTSGIGATGSYKLPGGLIIKWGTYSAGSNPVTITFASAFPTNCYGVAATIQANSNTATCVVYSVSTSGFTCAQGNATAAFFWIAVGN